VLNQYVRSFAAGFEGGLGVLGASASATESVSAPASAPAAAPSATRLLFMQSDGGLADAATFSGHRAILSGPAGGCVGYAKTTLNALGAARPVCAFDMGGTSTDVSRFSGSFEHVFESTTAGVTINAPQLDINTVAAGGGSRLFFRAGLYVVGPESAGAHPGPLCYRKGGFLAVTDANVHLGRIVADVFPKIFGPREDEPLDESASSAAFEALAGEIAAHTGGARPSSDEVAAGFIAVANEAMCRPIRALTQMRGFDLTTHVLACFGGAGPQHACAMARALGVSTIFISRFAGVLSAYGLLLADVVAEARAPCAESLAAAPAGSEDPGLCDAAVAAALAARLLALARDAGAQLAAQGAAAADVHLDLFVHARFLGTDSGLMVSVGTFAHAALLGRAAADAERDVAAALSQTPRDFAAAYRREFGFVLRGRQMLAEDLRVRATARGSAGPTFSVAAAPSAEPPRAARTRRVFFEGGRVETPVFSLDDLLAGHVVRGPALVLHTTTTIVVEPGFEAVVLPTGDVRIDALSAGGSHAESSNGSGSGGSGGGGGGAVTGQVEASLAAAGSAEAPPSAAAPAIPECDPIRLSVFAHRFMGIAEQMGRTLQRTAVSVNMRERLDYSCALFGLDGGLVANAPHIPVHLGAMQDAVRFQLAHWGAENLRDGDVLVSNHPQLAGGSHLPDITVITPVFSDGNIVFFVASRGHHADIGGIAPGAQRARARRLAQPRLPHPSPSLLTRRSRPTAPPSPPSPLSVQRRLNAAALALAVRGGRRDRGAQARERGRGLR
jgi:5-oxoprolinase (ATP-hydrolysing)